MYFVCSLYACRSFYILLFCTWYTAVIKTIHIFYLIFFVFSLSLINILHDSLIVTELCHGTLHDLVTAGNKDVYSRLSPYQLRYVILSQIVEGVKHLHANEIIHRDLKPHNILYRRIISEDGNRQLVMKLADFGCSRSVPAGAIHYTRTETKKGDYSVTFRPFGTDGWLAPEVLNGVKELTPPEAVDIYPLGLIIAFTLCEGQHPYGEDAAARDDQIKKNEPILEDIRQQLIDKHGDVCLGLINCMLNPKPKERPTAADVLNSVLKNEIFSPPPAPVIARDPKVRHNNVA